MPSAWRAKTKRLLLSGARDIRRALEPSRSRGSGGKSSTVPASTPSTVHENPVPDRPLSTTWKVLPSDTVRSRSPPATGSDEQAGVTEEKTQQAK
mgnify:CR=1 FL=1